MIQSLEQNKYYILMYSEIQQHFVEDMSRASGRTQSNTLPMNSNQETNPDAMAKQEVLFRKA